MNDEQLLKQETKLRNLIREYKRVSWIVFWKKIQLRYYAWKIEKKIEKLWKELDIE